MARRLTIRGISDELTQRLESLSRARGQSVKTTVLEILKAALGVDARRQRLARYATSTPKDLAGFDEALAAIRQRDLSDVAGTWQEDRELDEALADQDRVDERLWP